LEFRACALDGPGGSGKSTLARQLAADLNASIIPMDDFLLPPEKYRVSVVAKNYDLDRFDIEVAKPLSFGAPISYTRTNPDGYSTEKIRVPTSRPVIVDGIYSMDVRFRSYYDFTIFMDADKETLLRRATQIQGSSGTWLDKWLVGEETYLEAQSPISAATLILDGTKPLPTTSQVLELVQLRLEQENK
jgi:uridine kinase